MDVDKNKQGLYPEIDNKAYEADDDPPRNGYGSAGYADDSTADAKTKENNQFYPGISKDLSKDSSKDFSKAYSYPVQSGAGYADDDAIHKEKEEPPRDEWGKKIDFILSVVGFAVGLGNVWRFPYLCYKNGGGAFLIPYFICLIAGGVPMLMLEVGLGQFMKQGGYGVWNICPLMKGIGVATTIIAILCNIYYIVILSWDLYYLGMSFNWILPWSHCNNTWNTIRCRVSFRETQDDYNATLCQNFTDTFNSDSSVMTGAIDDNMTSLMNASCVMTSNISYVDPVVEFWERQILQQSDGVDQMDGMVWQLVVSLFCCWVLCYFCVWKGVKWTGKVVYFTATFPYVVLTILLIRGVTLDGAADGLEYYLKPNVTRLRDAQIWVDAGTQIFFSYAIALGAMAAMGSYNKFNNNFYKDCIIVSCINSFTSLYAGIAIFSVLGFMAKEQGVSVADVASSGPGLAFIAYPKAVTQMPAPYVWAVVFFLLIIFLGLDSQFVAMESVITVIVDQFPSLRPSWNKEIFVAVYCLGSFILALPMVTHGGIYVFQMFDYYAASGMALLWVCTFESLAIAWLYGGARFYDNISLMIGYRINPWLRICWSFLTPLMTGAIFIAMWVDYSPLEYNKYIFPPWAQGVGMSIAFISMIWIPIGIVFQLVRTPGSLKERWITCITPVYPKHVLEYEQKRKEQEMEGKKNKKNAVTPL